eukprot:357033-Chlamydomonas_euryale.AAC.5
MPHCRARHRMCEASVPGRCQAGGSPTSRLQTPLRAMRVFAPGNAHQRASSSRCLTLWRGLLCNWCAPVNLVADISLLLPAVQRRILAAASWQSVLVGRQSRSSTVKFVILCGALVLVRLCPCTGWWTVGGAAALGCVWKIEMQGGRVHKKDMQLRRFILRRLNKLRVSYFPCGNACKQA